MGFSLPHITILIAIIAIAIATLFQIIGVAAPGWIVVDISAGFIKAKYSSGLWEQCDSNGNCVNFGNDVDDWLGATRAFGLMGVIVMAGSCLCGLLMCLISSLQKIMSMAAPALAAAGALFSLIEWAIFLGELSESVRDYLGYSFGLTVTATILSLIAAIFFFLGRGKMGTS